uniref:Cilia and flagella associated protein 92 (putative) n=1 Tax=Macaca fascicularis TaxID=9541 RepID=A0A7N9DEA8_MACFA
MSLNAWEWEEDPASIEPISSITSFYQSTSECDVEEHLKAKARAQESDSDRQCSSTESSSETASTFSSDVPHVVPCTFTISLAFPVNTGHKGKYASLIEKYKKHPKTDSSVSKLRRFYHIEYFLLPDDGEPKKVDILLFPMVAKVFLESGVKTVKPWHEGDKAWVSWEQTFNINVTKELLKKINFHKITLRLWNSKDKMSRKVRYYRLKTAGFTDDVGAFHKSEVRHLVLNQRKFSEQGIENANIVKEESNQEYPPGRQEKVEKHPKSLQGSHQAEPENSSKNSEEYEKSPKMDDSSTVQWSVSRTPTISLAGASMMEIKELIESESLSSLTNILDRQRSQIKGKDSEGRKKIQRRHKKPPAEEEADPTLTGLRKQSAFSIQLAVMPLLAGWQTVMSRGSEKSANILDCLLTLKTEVPIMTEEQKQDLNPLTIKIKCASCLPSQPVPIQELERLCMPVYCKYQFHKTPVHKTKGEPHGTHVYFRDINVIFLGALHPSDLREYLEGPPMMVEVHDRDRKSEEFSQKPVLFGEDPLDSYLNFRALISPRETENNPFESQNKMWYPYGIAQVSFADLLLGHKYLNLAVPIHSCEVQPTHCSQDSRRRKVVGLGVPRDGHQHGPMPMGNYLEADSQLKLRVDIAVPLRAGAGAADPDLGGSQFGRIIFVFDFKKVSLLHSLLQDITMINAKALGLDSYPLRTLQQILSAFKMRVRVQEQQYLDVLTGFHLLDGKTHLFILEGLANQGLRQLWENHQSWIPRSEHGKYKVLYNSQLLFRSRLYGDLEAILYHVHLFQPTELLLQQAVLFLRDTEWRRVFQALTRIHDICYNSTTLWDVMPTPNLEDYHGRDSSLTLEIHAHQEKYLQWRSAMLLKNKDKKHSFIQKNITEAYQVSKKPPKSVAKVIKISAPANKAVYNYSIQTMNSTELAKKQLYQEMAKEPRKRFTYSQDYLSAMVEPLDLKEEEKKAQKKSRQAWLTARGFQVTGLQSDTEGSFQDLKLPPIKELNEEWKENSLFANVLEPVLDRDRWSWDRHHVDFDLYKKPPPFLKLPPSPVPTPVTGNRQGFAKLGLLMPWAGRSSVPLCIFSGIHFVYAINQTFYAKKIKMQNGSDRRD